MLYKRVYTSNYDSPLEKENKKYIKDIERKDNPMENPRETLEKLGGTMGNLISVLMDLITDCCYQQDSDIPVDRATIVNALVVNDIQSFHDFLRFVKNYDKDF